MQTENEMESADALDLHGRAERWLTESALPLWSSAGFDTRTGMFEERLDFDGSSASSAPRRLMVQARQIAVYAAASLSGRFPEGAELALRAARSMITAYLEGDGAPGWLFSVGRDGRAVNARRDLYAHAFALFALAWALRLDDDAVFGAAIDKTLDFLDSSFADPVHGGFWDSLPRPDALRRQNPHMHLFEAFIALYETTARQDILDRCRVLQELALTRFYDPASGALREYFDNEWVAHPAPGRGSVEPGHLFEWAWLLRQFEKAGGKPQPSAVRAMVAMARKFGLSPACGRIVDEIGEDGSVRVTASRCWPHTEALKALSEETWRGERAYIGDICRITRRLLDCYCVTDIEGGWMDRRDEKDKPASSFMPASTFYHIDFGLDALGGAAMTLQRLAPKPRNSVTGL